ncbi:MAG: UDP-N-acetylmuramyl-tripeptide synthetase [Polyangiaceae bacterium]
MPSLEVPAPPAFKAQLTTVGVTGTNGKTTTTAWAARALGALHRPVARSTTVGLYLDERELELPKSYDGFIAAMRACVDGGGRHVAVELTSEALLRGFAKAWPPEIGVFTNLSHDHLDAHGSPEHYLASKAQLFMALPRGGTAILNARDETAPLLADVIPAGVRVWTYGVPSRGEAALAVDLDATEVTTSWTGTTMRLAQSNVIPFGPSALWVPAIGQIFAENALAAYLAAVAAGVSPFAAAGALVEAVAPPGRFEVVARQPYGVVDFAHTPDAIERTLRTARALCRGRLVIVFGAGGKRDVHKRAAMGRAASVCDAVVLTSDNPRDEDPAAIAEAIRAGIEPGPEVTLELDRRRAISDTYRGLGPEDVLVVAGRGHETHQQIGEERVPLSDVEVLREAAR